MIRRRIRPSAKGHGCELDLPADERKLLEMLPNELSVVLAGLDTTGPTPTNLKRLFPPAYVRDEAAQATYLQVTRAELLDSHKRALAVLSETAEARSLDEEQMAGWMAALTELRLVLGTVLGVADDAGWEPDEPAASDAVIYQYLTMLQAELIDVMEKWLPDPVPGADDTVPDDPWGEPLGDLRWDGTQRPAWPPPPE